MKEFLLILTLLGGSGTADVEMTRIMSEDEELCESIGETWVAQVHDSSYRFSDSHFQCIQLTPDPPGEEKKGKKRKKKKKKKKKKK